MIPLPHPEPAAGVSAVSALGPEARIGGDPKVLHALAEPGSAVAIWRRDPDPALAGVLSGLPPHPFADVRASLKPQTDAAEIANLFAVQGKVPDRLTPWIDDLSRICEVYRRLVADLVEPGPLTLRLETLSDDGCRRFHVDRSRLRLLCTYRGPGTQWLTESQVDRAALESHAPNEQILRWGEPRALAPFWVAVMKGERFPGNAGRGLVHRSPPIAGTGADRILLCLDT